jgi:hypothetical protein
MTTWILLIALGGWGSVSDFKSIPMTELQCRQAITQLKPLKGKMGAVCIGTNGEKFGFEDVSD